MSNKSKGFRTPDLYFAAYLQTAGVELLKHERENNRVYFVFSVDIANIEELKTQWFNSTGKVSALNYANNVKSLKSICHMM